MLIASGGFVPPGLPAGASVIEGEYLARGRGESWDERHRPGSAPTRAVPIQPANVEPVDLYLRTGRPWAAPLQGRHLDLYV